MYCSGHILSLLPHLLEEEIDVDYWHTQYPGKQNISQVCHNFKQAELVIIEIATLKSFRNSHGAYMNNEFLKCDQDLSRYTTGLVTTDELEDNLRSIHSLLQENGKQVFFISHFNPDHIFQRGRIIQTLERIGLPFYNPTPLVLRHGSLSLSDQNHYHHEFERCVMKDILDRLGNYFVEK
jgi:hypothetical protein